MDLEMENEKSKVRRGSIRRADLRVAIDFIAVAFLVVFAGVWAWNQFITSPPYIDPERFPVRGIDVSVHNGLIDYSKVAESGVEFVFIKASEGAEMKDRNYRINYDGARKAGLKVGAYHFFRFDKDGVTQAVNLLDALGSRVPELGIAVDVEEAGNAHNVPLSLIRERLRDMADFLNLKGHRVMFYSNKDGYYEFLIRDFPGYPLWICSFSSTPINTDWTFWQYNHHGNVNGIKGDVDCNVFNGSREDWKEFVESASTASWDSSSISEN